MKMATVIPVSFMLPSSEERSLESGVTGRTHRVYVGLPAKESQNMLTSIRPFGAYLRVEQPNVSLTTTELAEETHNSGVSIGLIYGLRAIYNAGGQ
jgi:hypothetical protein